jgi:hypothetical protein
MSQPISVHRLLHLYRINSLENMLLLLMQILRFAAFLNAEFAEKDESVLSVMLHKRLMVPIVLRRPSRFTTCPLLLLYYNRHESESLDGSTLSLFPAWHVSKGD